MGDFLAAIRASGQALTVFGNALEAIQSNITNANTPGYARQDPVILPDGFSAAPGSFDGIRSGPARDSRSPYAEHSVWRQTSLQEGASQLGLSLQQIAPLFDTSDAAGSAGIRADLNNMTSAFRSWALQAGDTTTRQRVIDAAQNLANTFRSTSQLLSEAGDEANRQIGLVTDTINGITADLAKIGKELKASGGSQDASLQTQLYAKLQDLSQYIDFNFSQQADGSFTITTGKNTPLVIGETAFQLKTEQTPPGAGAQYPDGRPTIRILSADGSDQSDAITGGKLGGLLQFSRRIIPSLIGDGSQQGDLNRLAQAYADSVNSTLTGGVIPGPPPTPGVALFTYGSDPASIASTISVNPAITPDQLATDQTSPAQVANGVPAQLAALETSSDPKDKVGPGNLSFQGFLSSISTRIVNEQTGSADRVSLHGQLLEQARQMRDQASGVSLEEQAVALLDFQRSYQAIARVISVLDQLTQDTIALGK